MNTWNQTNQAPYFNGYARYSAPPIKGENAAWQFPMGNNSEIYLPDADQDIIWWIRTDNAGNRSVMGWDVTPHKKPEPVDMNDILTRLNVLEEKINAKSNKPITQSTTTSNK